MFISRFFRIFFGFYQIFRQHNKVEKGLITKDAFGRFLKMKLEQLGPTFIKVGQILSLRPDLVPVEYCMPLRDLLDKTEEMDLEEVMYILKKELGRKPKDVFSHISKRPVASASIAQVHKARIKDSNEFVALKIKKPNVEKIIRTDVAILKFLNTVFYPLIQRRINSRSFINDLQSVLDKEVDFSKEGSNVERFKEVFKDIHFVKTPKIYWEYTSRNLLVMEFIPGITLKKVFHTIDTNPELRNHETIEIDGIIIHKRKLAQKLIQVVAHSIFDAGFFHADPHPANIILTLDNKVAYIDFGMVGDMLNNEKILFREIVYCIGIKDEEKLLQLLIEYNKTLGYPSPDKTTILHLKHFMHDILSDFVTSDQKNFPITKFMYTLGSMSFKFSFPPPSFLMLITKQIFTLEGLAGYLIPDLNVINEFQPYVYSFRTKDSFKKFTNEKMAKFLDETTTLGMNLPESLNILLQNIKQEGLVNTPHAPFFNRKLVFSITALYLVFLGIVLPSFHVTFALLILCWGSIIAMILILYLLLYNHG